MLHDRDRLFEMTSKPTTIARHHHYLPQCYLAGFAVQRKKGQQVFAFDRVTRQQFQTNVKNVAQERDFNRIEVEGYPPDAFEQMLAGFEAELGPALHRIGVAGSLDAATDRLVVMNFLSWAAVHNPRHRETIRKFHEDVSTRVLDLASATPERWAGQMRKAREAGFVARDGDDLPYDQVKKFIDDRAFRLKVPNELHLRLATETVEVVFKTMVDRKWWLLRAPADSAGFVTSDHPLSLMWADPTLRGGVYGPGLGLRGTQVFAPLSSRIALVGAFELEEQADEISNQFVAEINAVTILYARRQVYARDLNFEYAPVRGAAPKKASRLIADRFFLRAEAARIDP